MVRGWAADMNRDPTLRLADIARKTGLSRARVTQLMPLARLAEATLQEHRHLGESTSIRALLKLAAALG